MTCCRYAFGLDDARRLFPPDAELYPHIVFSFSGRVETMSTRDGRKEITGWAVIRDSDKNVIPAGILVTHENIPIACGSLSELREDVAAAYELDKNEAVGFAFDFPCSLPDESLSFYAVRQEHEKCSLYPLSGGSIYRRTGVCPVCGEATTFYSKECWLRDNLVCSSCGSLPRIRHFLSTLEAVVPAWRALALYEIAPDSKVIARKSSNYVFSHYFPETSEQYVDGTRNENIENLSFPDATFDVVVCADVLEHVFRPAHAIREMCRIVKPGGKVLFSTPVFRDRAETVCRARLKPDGSVEHLLPPVYHGNPISSSGSLVTFDFADDFERLLAEWLHDVDHSLTNRNDVELEHGIAGEFLDLFIITKI